MDLENSKDSVKAYLLPYESNVSNKDQVGMLILPKRNPEATLVITPTLTGCSIIVEEACDHYKVYHDPRPGMTDIISREYQNVAAFIQPEQMEYIDSKNNKKITLGFALLSYDKNHEWQLLLQTLKFTELDKKNGIQHLQIDNEHPNPVLIPLLGCAEQANNDSHRMVTDQMKPVAKV